MPHRGASLHFQANRISRARSGGDQFLFESILASCRFHGGFMPVSVFLSSEEVLQWMNPGSHGSTFGGNPLGSAIAKRSLELLEEEGLIENSRLMGDYFKKSPFF